MKTLIISTLLIFSLNNLAFGQSQNIKMVQDIGQVLADDDYLKPAKVLPIIFAKLEKKYKLANRTKQVESTVTELIKLRRKYKASGETRALMYLAYDHAIAGVLSFDRSPVQAYNAACDGAKRQLLDALQKYDTALKAYQKCLNQSSFSMPVEIQNLNSFLGGTMSDNPMSASGSGCQPQTRELKRAKDAVTKWSRIAGLACK